MPELDLLVLGEANVDLIVQSEDPTPVFGQENEQKQGLWQTEFGTLAVVQEGPMVWGTFDYHGGRVIGSMHCGKLYGYWR